MAQCKAKTNAGSQCLQSVKPPSKSLCTRHQKVRTQGKDVVNFDTGRKFPKPR